MQSDKRPFQFSPNTDQLFEDADDSQERLKFIEVHIARKKAQEDAKILKNRIALLKSEETNVRKKIDDTRVKTQEVVQVQERNNGFAKNKEDVYHLDRASGLK